MSDLADLLRAGNVDAFNAQRGQRRRVDLFAEDFAGAAIAGADLSGANLEKADLSGADLSEANLNRADLSGVDAPDANFSCATLVGARVKEAMLEGADLTDADASHADLSETSLVGTKGARSRWNNARLRQVDATRVTWPEADFAEAKLHKANFTGASLQHADFTEAHAGEANFSGADLEACVGLRARFPGAILAGAKLREARLEEANLQGADLSGANLERADLRRANLAGAKLAGACLRGANLADSVLEGVDFADIDLSDVDLSGVDARALGLTTDQLAHVAAVGASASADAPLKLLEVTVARGPSGIGIFWENEDDESTLSLRWAIMDDGEPTCRGVLPVSSDGVLARGIAPLEEGFLLLVIQERPGGVALLRYRVSEEGELGTAKVEPLGYEPGVRPVVRTIGSTVYMWGLSRRGPAVLVHRLADDESAVNASARVPTARGFIGAAPVLSCKGGVVIPVAKDGPKAPLRTPPGFDERHAAAAIVGEHVFVAWAEPQTSDDEPGGVRFAVLGDRAGPRVEVVSRGGPVTSLDMMAVGDEAWIAWAQGDEAAFVTRVGEGAPIPIDFPEDFDVAEVRFAADLESEDGAPGPSPIVSLMSGGGKLLLADNGGHVIGTLGDDVASES